MLEDLKKKKKKCLQSSVLKAPGKQEGWWRGCVKMVMSRSRLSHRPNRVPITVMAAVFISFCKYESPCPDSDFKHGGGRPYQATASQPALPLCTSNPRLTTAARAAIMRYAAAFNCVWSVWHSLSSCVTCRHFDLCVKTRPDGPGRRPPPRLWDASCSGQHQSSARSLGQQSGLCTHTHTQINTQPIQRESSFREAPSFLKTTSCVLRKVCKANHPLITFKGDFHQQSSLVPEFPL